MISKDYYPLASLNTLLPADWIVSPLISSIECWQGVLCGFLIRQPNKTERR